MYGIGLLVGIVLSFLFLGDRLTTTSWMPKDRIKDRLSNTLTKASGEVNEQLQSLNITINAVRESMPNADIILGDTERTEDTIFYHVRSTVNEVELDMVIAGLRDFSVDSSATIIEIR